MEYFNLRKPPTGLDFVHLMKFVWDHGCGNELNIGKNPTPWTYDSFEHAYEDFNHSVDQRTIQNWVSGRNLPSRRNIYIMSRILSRGDEELKTEWMDALIAARQVTLDQNKKLKNSLQNTTRKNVVGNKKGKSTKPSSPNISKMLKIAVSIIFGISLFGTTLFLKKANSELDKTIAILPLRDLSLETDKSYFAESVSEEIINGLAKVPELTIRSKTATSHYHNTDFPLDKISKELDVNYLLEGSFRKSGQKFKMTVRLIQAHDGNILWAENYTENISQLFSTEEIIAQNIVEALGVYIDENKRETMFNFGTRNVKAYEHYLEGRALLKNWHETSIGDDIWHALASFQDAIETDPKMAKAYFHSVDPYFHFAKGELSNPPENLKIKMPSASHTTQDIIEDLLSKAESYAKNETDAAQYRVNKIIFSNDWTNLREAASSFGSLAAKDTGELEWEFGPVALLITGEHKILQDLVENRILKYDPLNGTAHSYSVRSYLLDAKPGKASKRLKAANATSFSRRLEEVEAYLHFYNKDTDALEAHLATAQSLTNSRIEYFSALPHILTGENETAIERLITSKSLEFDRPQLALGLMHSGATELSSNILDELDEDWVSPLNFAAALAYGAGCGENRIDLIPTLKERFAEAEIINIPCANLGE